MIKARGLLSSYILSNQAHSLAISHNIYTIKSMIVTIFRSTYFLQNTHLEPGEVSESQESEGLSPVLPLGELLQAGSPYC